MVVVVVFKVEDYCSYVKLLEFSGKEGAIAPNELTRSKSKRKGHFKALKVGRVEVMRVLKVDKVRGFIDLSKKSVYPKDEQQAKDNYAKVRLVNSMLVGVVEATKCDIGLLYEKIIWPLHRKGVSPIDFFKHHQDELDLIKEVPPELIARLKVEIDRRLKIIKEALSEGEKHQVDDLSVRYTIQGSPVYLASVETIKEKAGKEVMREANERVREVILKYGGSFKVKEEPKALGSRKDDDGKIEEEDEESESSDGEDSGMGSADEDDLA
ncbi:uncharacterized protein LOC127594533 [Hippocampus zosterae]|uniref:uncharacterized protein LOC127594533 n=1 Tax=Hippocampus zosterae TaxID=109293 RepID=UPI00223E6BCF|nr:uncharacterized protein LOC127594533 [Hippocampus zosterae]